MKKKIVVGISGASGAIIGIKLLEALKVQKNWHVHLVISKGGERTITHETLYKVEAVKQLADVCYDIDDIGAAIASGTFETSGMVVVPCSMKTLAGVASGYSDNLLLRAADVVIKEKRNLVLVPREAPFSPIHLRNMHELSNIGVVMISPVLSFYSKQETVEDMINHIVGKILDQFKLNYDQFERWY